MDFKIELVLIYGWGKREIGIFFKNFTIASSGGLHMIVEVGTGGDIYHWNFEIGDNYYQNFEAGGSV